jgi:hypothetical protein
VSGCVANALAGSAATTFLPDLFCGAVLDRRLLVNYRAAQNPASASTMFL